MPSLTIEGRMASHEARSVAPGGTAYTVRDHLCLDGETNAADLNNLTTAIMKRLRIGATHNHLLGTCENPGSTYRLATNSTGKAYGDAPKSVHILTPEYGSGKSLSVMSGILHAGTVNGGSTRFALPDTAPALHTAMARLETIPSRRAQRDLTDAYMAEDTERRFEKSEAVSMARTIRDQAERIEDLRSENKLLRELLMQRSGGGSSNAVAKAD